MEEAKEARHELNTATTEIAALKIEVVTVEAS